MKRYLLTILIGVTIIYVASYFLTVGFLHGGIVGGVLGRTYIMGEYSK